MGKKNIAGYEEWTDEFFDGVQTVGGGIWDNITLDDDSAVERGMSKVEDWATAGVGAGSFVGSFAADSVSSATDATENAIWNYHDHINGHESEHDGWDDYEFDSHDGIHPVENDGIIPPNEDSL